MLAQGIEWQWNKQMTGWKAGQLLSEPASAHASLEYTYNCGFCWCWFEGRFASPEPLLYTLGSSQTFPWAFPVPSFPKGSACCRTAPCCASVWTSPHSFLTAVRSGLGSLFSFRCGSWSRSRLLLLALSITGGSCGPSRGKQEWLKMAKTFQHLLLLNSRACADRANFTLFLGAALNRTTVVHSLTLKEQNWWEHSSRWGMNNKWKATKYVSVTNETLAC